ncbi:MAG: lipocalin family protein [Candidatus Aureabacteria bacterium]|nr:lipocalin family protein [Candidatus Auribacterota bacterium]
MKKKFFIIFFAAVLLLVIQMDGLSFEDDDFIGTWIVVSFSELELPKDQKTYYIFEKNGVFIKKLIVYDYEEKQVGQWELEAKAIKISFSDKKRIVIYDVSFEGSDLILRRLGMTTTLKKAAPYD